MKKRIFNIIITVIILLALMSLSAAAQTDSAGNVFISDSDPSSQTVERDLYWAGSSRAFNGFQIGKSLIAAGRDITVSDSEVGGSLRTGSYSVTLNGVDVEDNITSAGYNLQLSGVTASGVYLVGNTVYFNGTADHVSIAGGTVTLDGEISGDADIYGANVVLGENLQVGGTLTVQTEKEPALPSGSKIGQFVFKANEPVNVSENVTVEVKESKPASGFGKFIRGLLGTLLLAALMVLLLGTEEIGKPGEMLLARPLPMLGTGFAAVFVIPGIILILLFIGIGFPSAGLLAILFAVACIYSLTFAGITVAKTLIPKFTDNNILNNDWVCSLIGALVFWLFRKIPVIGAILQFAAVIYTLGYFIQTIILRFKRPASDAPKGTVIASPSGDALEPVSTVEPEEITPVSPEVPAETETEEPADSVISVENDVVTEKEDTPENMTE